MGRNNTKAVKNITKMYEQLGLAQDDIFHKTKLLLSIYRDVVWATLSDCNCVNEEIYYYGDDLTDALVYLEEFAPDIERSEFERRVCNLFENKWMIEQTSLDLKTLLKVLRSSTSFEELTPTLVNSLIRRIEVHNNDKSSGHCYVKVDIYFTAIGLIDIPTEDEIKSLMAKIKANPQEYRLTA